MDAENDDQTSDDSSSQSQTSSEQTGRSKLRDLKPEKDPMGAGKKTQSQPPVE